MYTTDREFIRKEWEQMMDNLQRPEHKWKHILQRVFEVYEAPGRHHHTLAHIRMCLEHANEASHLVTNPRQLKFAIIFHDYINEIGGNDNELRSGYIATEAVKELGFSKTFADMVMLFIKATTHKVGTKDEEKGRTIDEDIVADIDLAILGQSEAVYDAYVENIRKEYASIDDEIFYPKRLEIMESFLSRKFIYRTARFANRFGKQARENIEREIADIKELISA